jgi:hypothetical protein
MSNLKENYKPITKEEIDVYIANIQKYQTKENTGREFGPKLINQVRHFAQYDDGKPFFMLNFIKENKNVYYPDNWTGKRAATIEEAKKLYTQAVLSFLKDKSSSPVIGIAQASPPANNDSKNPEIWDHFLIVRYESRRTFLDMLSSEYYSKAIVHKHACDKNTVLIPVTEAPISEKIKNCKNDNIDKPITKEETEAYIANIKKYNIKENTGRDLDPKVVDLLRYFAEHDDGKPFFMINLIKERDKIEYPVDWIGPKGNDHLQVKKLYTDACLSLLMQKGANTSFSVFGTCLAFPSAYNDTEFEEDWDQFYLVRYDNRKAFLDMVSSEAYAKGSVHKHAGDKYTVTIPVSLANVYFK